MGGNSIARVVSCDFNDADPIGARMAAVQRRLMAYEPMIDNPLRVPMNHDLVRSGVIKVRKVKDLASIRTISIAPESKTYLGHCSGCSELCGVGLVKTSIPKPAKVQRDLFNGEFGDECSVFV